MESIKILPHHAVSYFEVFYLNDNPTSNGWYNDEKMKQNGADAIRRVVENPNQLVQIVSIYDEWCRMCPHNDQGDNYDGETDWACLKDKRPNSEKGFAKILGLEEVLDGKLIASKEFFDLMKPTYERLMSEPEFDENNKRMPLHSIFRVPLNIQLNYIPTESRVAKKELENYDTEIIFDSLLILNNY
tara:strand:+ start:2492 stop:3052 length:561 start_codon:yes stop_codon:yes gene_type:complete